MNDQTLSPPIGHNSGLTNLGDILVEETAALRQRAEHLAAGAGRCVITDDETAGKATLLAKMLKEHVKVIDEARTSAKDPYLTAGRAVDAHFAELTRLIAIVDSKGKVIGGPLANVLGMVDSYRREQDAKAEAERRRLEEEARRQREAAEAAERARREAEEKAAREAEEARRRIEEAAHAAREAGDREAAEKAARERAEAEKRASEARAASLQAEMESRKRQEEAEALERQAAETKTAAIDSGLGAKASGRKVCRVEITDLKAALKHALKVDEASVLAAVQAIYDRQVKVGVRTLPGAVVHESTVTVIR